MTTRPDEPDEGQPERSSRPGRDQGGQLSGGGPRRGAGRGGEQRGRRSGDDRGSARDDRAPRRGDQAARRENRPRTGSGGAPRGSARSGGSWRAPGREGGQEPERPFRPARKPPPQRPQLPEERPHIPRAAWRDLRATVPPNVVDDVVRAVGAATDALEAGDDARAMELLSWAKSAAPRSATIREALGIAHYAAERYSEAHSELLAYRRLSGAQDQNHVLADCARAAGRQDKVREYVDQMIAARVDDERIAEGLMVLAGDRADHDDLDGALETLARAGLDPSEVQPYHPRLWYLAADLSERLGRREEAREYFEAILAVDEDFGDVEERLAALD